MNTIQVEIVIGGRNYRLNTLVGEETRLRALAARVDAMINEMRSADPAMDRDRQLMLACLQLASDVAEAHQKLDDQAMAVTHFHRGVSERLEKLLPQS